MKIPVTRTKRHHLYNNMEMIQKMKTSTTLALPLLIIGLLLGCGPQRDVEESVENSHLKMKDWFLSAGDWETDPQLYVREFGAGKDTIIVLHGGWGAEHSGLVTAVKDLGKDFHFFFYEQRGSLRSPFPDSLITFDHHIEDLELLRKELKLDQMTLAGHSMGGVLASAYAHRYPEHIKKLVLLAPARLREPLPETDKELQHQEYLASVAYRNRPETEEELDKYGLNRKSPPLSSKEETMKYRINMGKLMLSDISKWPQMTGGRALYKAHVYGLTEKSYPPDGWDFIAEFRKRDYPVVIISGNHDWLAFGNLLNKKWTSDIPHMVFHEIDNAGHLLWIDQADELTRALRQHLK
ncbi:alpha/beta fold hydrolase [Spongiimicrobium sp. 2-473A-2-J]|uniref:alpha/beta fold hydrolase n=1 Tax=Eudoraea algarum TaxID=3417568 RepID=UPI003D363688